jgi:prevent-host-death family protein
MGGNQDMETVAISTLRQNLSIFLKKAQEGQVITITSRGHEMARLVPAENMREKSRVILRKVGKNALIGDILSPISDEWEAMK